jgi:hypothetical protein
VGGAIAYPLITHNDNVFSNRTVELHRGLTAHAYEARTLREAAGGERKQNSSLRRDFSVAVALCYGFTVTLPVERQI